MNAFELRAQQFAISPLPNDAVVAMAYVPYQNPRQVYSAEQGLNSGTMFPSLDKPFTGCAGDIR